MKDAYVIRDDYDQSTDGLQDKCPECATEFSDDSEDTKNALADKESWPFGRMPKLKGCEACNPVGH